MKIRYRVNSAIRLGVAGLLAAGIFGAAAPGALAEASVNATSVAATNGATYQSVATSSQNGREAGQVAELANGLAPSDVQVARDGWSVRIQWSQPETAATNLVGYDLKIVQTDPYFVRMAVSFGKQSTRFDTGTSLNPAYEHKVTVAAEYGDGTKVPVEVILPAVA